MSAATATSPLAPDAGWYPDPHAAGDHLRWWDGATWTNLTTDPLDPEPAPEAPRNFADFVADVGDGTEIPVDDERLEDIEPIEFSWSDPSDLFEVTVAEAPDTTGPFAFRARPLLPNPEAALEVPTLPVYESPLGTIASPLSVRVQVPVRVEVPVASSPAPPQAAPALPAAPAVVPRRRVAVAGTGAAIAVAATAALVTNLLGNDPAPAKRAAAVPALSAPQRACMKQWNITAGGSAAELRVTLGQFEGALARVSRVDPLPGTVMAPDSCALTVYDASSDTHAVFVSGVKDQDGYLDLTSYPRASTYGWPKTARQANVTVRSDGTLRTR